MWKRDLIRAALEGDWGARARYLKPEVKNTWSTSLTATPDWRRHAVEHFEGVFFHAEEARVEQHCRELWETCSRRRWGNVPAFQPEELKQVAAAWKPGRATGPTGYPTSASAPCLSMRGGRSGCAASSREH